MISSAGSQPYSFGALVPVASSRTRAISPVNREGGRSFGDASAPPPASSKSPVGQTLMMSEDVHEMMHSLQEESLEGVPPSTRKALTTYTTNQHLSRIDANVDYISAVDVFA